MSAGHTPGPWTYGPNGYQNWPFKGGYNGTIVGADGEEIYAGPASFNALCGKTEKQAEANARLIAAAPELLEALENDAARFRRIAEKLRDGGLASPTNRLAFADYVLRCEVEATAAIAKATGAA